MGKLKPLPELINGFRVVDDLGIVDGFRTLIIECKVCGKHVSKQRRRIRELKSCGCRGLKPLPEYINGFRVISCVGYIKDKYSNKRFAYFECKICRKSFKHKVTNITNIGSCGCLEGRIKSVPDEINGFKIIKDLGLCTPAGWSQHTRSVIALCKRCGKEFLSPKNALSALTKGCSKLCAKSNGGTKRLARVLEGMKARCYNRNHVSFTQYSSNKIVICDEWMDDSRTFYEWALANGYKDDLTIDRIDNSLGYSPENCRWADKHIQAQNSSQAKLTFDKVVDILELLKEMPQKDIAKLYGVSRSAICSIARGIRWKNVPRND